MERYRPLKNLARRIWLWLAMALILVLADEYVKEGYLFNPGDLLVPFTHEQIALSITVAMVLYGVASWLRRRTIRG